MLKTVKNLLVVLVLISTQKAWSQGQGSSPYATLGVGEINSETVAAQDMMGGAGVSFTNTFYLNQINPALIVKNRSIGFNKYVALNVGLKGAYSVLSQGANIQENFGLNLSGISMAFPLKPKWAMAVGIKPYSSADFTAVKEKTFDGSTVKNSTEYKSSGGLTKVNMAHSFQIAKGLYFGVDASVLFGNIVKDTTSVIVGTNTYYRNSARTNLHGVNLKGGLAYQYKINKKWNANIGAVYNLGSDLKGEQIRTFSVLGDNGNGPAYILAPDTLGIRNISSSLPSSVKFGVSLESAYHWVFAADYGMTKWAGINQYDKVAQATFKDATELNLGIEWLPNASSSKYINQIFYRAGYKQIQSPFVVNGTQILDKSFSFGISVPMGFRNPSYVDLGVAIGQRGVNSGGIIAENYTKISANFSLLSTWFNKPKID
jgi:hypothetical protein